MSDPVTNVEMEDVLSSIRRLVSADDRPEKQAAEDESAADKLVLTPALRVDNDAAPDSEEAVQEDTDDQAAAEAAPDDADASDDPSDTAEQDVWEAGSEPQDEADEDAPEDVVFEDDTADVNDDGMTDAEASDHADEEEGETVEMPTASMGLTAHIAEIEEAVAAREDDWEPDGEAGDANAAQPMATLQWQDHMPVEPDQPDGPGVASETEGLDPFVPDDDPADAAQVYAEEIVDDDTESATAPGNAFLTDDDLLEDSVEAIIDEETLRDLVTEIVRQELQGSLGERITRNVRKLVRREIQRALAAQDLD